MHSFHTLETLAQTVAGKKPARLAVLGKPVSHSASPQLHQPALDALGINATYIRLQVDPGRLREALVRMAELDFIGCNVTVPHKFEALESCTEVSAQAQLLGAVNTVLFKEGAIIGYNTDAPGFRAAISDSFGLDLAQSATVILGAGGGAGQAIATQCALEKPDELTLVNRNVEKVQSLAERLSEISPRTRIRTFAFTDADLRDYCLSSDLIVQTTSLGLKEDDGQVIPDDYFFSESRVYDTIYQPPETPFLAAAKRAGCKTDNGLSLLIHQGAIAFQHWFPGTDPLPHMRRAMNR
ncbi:MAG: shikimate dehydrogenase [Verrucomicrobiota bacterium]|jgi:shikimate dehydrogenase